MKTLLTHNRRGVRAPAQPPAFNPALPEDGALIIAGVLRDQFNALEGEIAERATLAQLSAEIATLDATLADYEARITALEAEVTQLQTEMTDRPTSSWVTDAVNTGSSNAIATAVAQSSNNSNQVTPLATSAYPNYEQWQMQALFDKIDELINALRRV